MGLGFRGLGFRVPGFRVCGQAGVLNFLEEGEGGVRGSGLGLWCFCVEGYVG